MIKTMAAFVVLYSALSAGASYLYMSPLFAYNVLIGSAVVLLNLAALTFSWKRIFSKKSIALAVFVIIFKYVILGMILWGLSSAGWLNVIGFLVGLASLLFSMLALALVKFITTEKI